MNIMFKDLGISMNEHAVPVQINNQTIAVKQYLPISDKYDIIHTAITNSFEDGVCNHAKLYALTRLYIICLYTDIELDEEDRNNTFEIFDALESQGVIDTVLSAIPAVECKTIWDLLNKEISAQEAFNNSVTGALNSLIQDLPKILEHFQKLMGDIDLSQFKSLQDIMNMTNGAADPQNANESEQEGEESAESTAEADININ